VTRADPLLDYRLTAARVDALHKVHHDLYRLQRRDPVAIERLAEVVEEFHPEEYEQAITAIQGEPTVRRAIERAGFSVRDFYLTQYNLVSASVVLEARVKGRSDHLPEVSEANVEFVRRNAPLVRRVMSERRPRDP
jgi:hypothetical protein